MSKSSKELNIQTQEAKPGLRDNLKSLKEGAIKMYESADNAVIKATTFDSVKAMKGLKRAAVLALALSPVGIGLANMEKANAANNESTTSIPTVEQIVASEANKPSSPVSKGGIAKGLKEVMGDGKFTAGEVANFVVARNIANGFSDKIKSESETKAILGMVESGKDVLQATSEVVFATPEAQAQAAKDILAKTKTDAEIYGKLVVDAQQRILQKQSEQKVSPTPFTTPSPKTVPSTPSNPSSGPSFKGFPVGSLLKNAETIIGSLLPGEAASAAVLDGKVVKVDRLKVFNTMAQDRIDKKNNNDQTKFSTADNIEVFTRDLFPGVSREDRENHINRTGLRPYFRSLTLDLQNNDRSSVAASRIEKTFKLIADSLDNSTIPIETKQSVDKSKGSLEDQAAKNVLSFLVLTGAIGAGAVGAFKFRKKSQELDAAKVEIDSKKLRLTENANEIAALKKELLQRDQTIARKDSDINNLDTEVDSLNNSSKLVEGDSLLIDSLKQNAAEDWRTIDSLENQNKELRETLLQFRQQLAESALLQSNTQKRLEELEKKIPKSPSEIKRDEDKKKVSDFVEQLRKGFEKIVSKNVESHEIKIGNKQIETLDGIDNNTGISNVKKLITEGATLSGYKVESVIQTAEGVKFLIKKDDIKKELPKTEPAEKESDDFWNSLDELLVDPATKSTEIDDTSDIKLETKEKIISIEPLEPQSAEKATEKLTFEVFDVKKLTRAEKNQFAIVFRGLSSRNEDIPFEHITHYFNNASNPDFSALMKVYPNILSEMYSYCEGRFNTEGLNNFFDQAKTSPDVFIEGVSGNEEFVIATLNEIVIKIRKQVESVSGDGIFSPEEEKQIETYSNQAIQNMQNGQNLIVAMKGINSLPNEIRPEVTKRVNEWRIQNQQTQSTPVTAAGQKFTVVGSQPKPVSTPEPIPVTESAPELEMTQVERNAKIDGLVQLFLTEKLARVDSLIANNQVFNVDKLRQQLFEKIKKDIAIPGEYLTEYLEIKFQTLANGLVSSSKFEYTDNGSRLSPTQKPELIQLLTEPVVIPVPQPRPQTYSSIDAAQRSTNGHRNVPINENGVITAFNTGIGFVPENLPQNPTQSVNSAPAAPNPPESPRPPISPKSPESKKTLVEGPAKAYLKKLQQMLEIDNDLSPDQRSAINRVMDILNIVSEITASQTTELMQIRKNLPQNYVALVVDAWQENKRSNGAIL